MFPSFAKKNVMQKAGREEKFSVFKLSRNFSVYLRLYTHYEIYVLTASTVITATYFVLRVVSVEIQTSRSEAHHQST
jgi:hypothetical protein